jgi:hypothetical protein
MEKIKETEKEHKMIECKIDHMDMFQFKRDFIKKEGEEYVCDGQYTQSSEDEIIPVKFRVEHTYDIFSIFGHLWGDWNQCPSWNAMERKAKEWYEKYDAELIQIAHDTLKFQCKRKLTEEEIIALLEDIEDFAPNSLDVTDYDVIKAKLMGEGIFVLWWD